MDELHVQLDDEASEAIIILRPVLLALWLLLLLLRLIGGCKMPKSGQVGKAVAVREVPLSPDLISSGTDGFKST